MRRLDTALLLFGPGLYKARAPHRQGPNSRRRNSGFASRPTSLLYDGIERNISMQVALSVVVPVKDEAENIAPLAREIALAIGSENSAEIVFVADGSSHATARTLLELKASLPQLRVVQHGRNMGQSRGVRTGVRAARGDIIVVLDGDGQNDPADIPRLPAESRKGEAARVGLVQGQ